MHIKFSYLIDRWLDDPIINAKRIVKITLYADYALINKNNEMCDKDYMGRWFYIKFLWTWDKMILLSYVGPALENITF